MQRRDDFAERRKHLASLSETELEQRFWQLAEQVVRPLVDLSKHNTSPSVERSVLLRMGLSSLEAKQLAEMVADRGLLGKGAGHVVYVLAEAKHCSVREAADLLLGGQGWEAVLARFGEEG
jgi:D-ornithine 4,5-aminomutase subunit alpha